MQSRFRVARWLGLVLALWASGVAYAGDVKIRVQLIWGTSEEKPSDKSYKELDPAVRAKLLNNLKWKNYFVVKSHDQTVGKEACQFVLSERCKVGLNPVAKGKVEVQIFNLMAAKPTEAVFTKEVSLDALKKGDTVAIGSNSKDRWDDAWLVLVSAAD